jgi:hypothetical protein
MDILCYKNSIQNKDGGRVLSEYCFEQFNTWRRLIILVSLQRSWAGTVVYDVWRESGPQLSLVPPSLFLWECKGECVGSCRCCACACVYGEVGYTFTEKCFLSVYALHCLCCLHLEVGSYALWIYMNSRLVVFDSYAISVLICCVRSLKVWGMPYSELKNNVVGTEHELCIIQTSSKVFYERKIESLN